MVLTGSEVQDLFKHAKANKFAIPAVNVMDPINQCYSETASKLNHCYYQFQMVEQFLMLVKV